MTCFSGGEIQRLGLVRAMIRRPEILVIDDSETEEEFDDTIRFCKEVKFDYIWQHNFSARKGTEAEKLEHQISDNIKHSRIYRIKEEVGKIWCDTRISLPSMNAEDYNVGSKAQG